MVIITGHLTLDAWREVANPPDVDVEFDDSAVRRYDATDGGPLF